MNKVQMMRAAAAATVLAAAVLAQGCTSSGMSAAPQALMAGSPGPYSGDAWYADLDAAMTGDMGGGGE